MSGDPFLALPGVVEVDGAPSHFGAPLIEQRELESGNGIVSLAHHGTVTVTGEDRLNWLHSITSQRLAGAAPGESVETLVLSPQGRIEHAIRFVDDGETSWLLVDEGQAESLTEYLLRMRFAMRVEVQNRSDAFAAVAAFGGGTALPALRNLGFAMAEWSDPWANVLPGGLQYARGEHAGAGWNLVQLIFQIEDLPAVTGLVDAGKVRASGTMSLEALRIRAWRPSQQADVDDRTIPHELDWMRTAVHMDKGCYRGQETVAKVHNLGRPPRRLVLLHLDGSGGELPQAGALIFPAGSEEGARPVGRVNRAALHHEWGGLALTLLKRSVPEDSELEVVLGDPGDEEGRQNAERVTATQEVIVPSDAGRTREIPRLGRLA